MHSRLTCFGASVLIIRFSVFSQHGNMLKYGNQVVSDKINVLVQSGPANSSVVSQSGQSVQQIVV